MVVNVLSLEATRRRCTWNDSSIYAIFASWSISTHFLVEPWPELAMGMEESEYVAVPIHIVKVLNDEHLSQFTKSTMQRQYR